MKTVMCLAALVLSAGAAVPSFAATINSVETGYTGTAEVTTLSPVIDYIASYPVVSDGYTYTNYAILADDGTGSVEIFGKLPAGTTYVPTVGDSITVSGSYAPYQGIPELSGMTAISPVSSGNPVLFPMSTTIPALDAAALTPNYGLSEYLVSLSGITLSGATTFATHGNTTLTGTDASSNAITVYQWASSYEASGLLGGTAVPTGPVTMTGIFDVYNSAPEFIPFSITGTPEPASLGLLGMGAVAMLSRRRRTA